MRIMLDTNILISAAFFRNVQMDETIEFITMRHDLILADVVIDEFIEVASYKKFDRVEAAKRFISKLPFTLFETPDISQIEGVTIRDESDYPILFTAIKSEVDIFITGDKDFLESSITTPVMMTISQFKSKYIQSE